MACGDTRAPCGPLEELRLHKVPDLSRLEFGIDFVFLSLCEFLIAVSRLEVSLVEVVAALFKA
jgi:hypothetical protein